MSYENVITVSTSEGTVVAVDPLPLLDGVVEGGWSKHRLVQVIKETASVAIAGIKLVPNRLILRLFSDERREMACAGSKQPVHQALL
ncbi:hypothetical protein TNCT_557951 [Trichonephila clavata]|uniref:Uncharacterized protein n=1 Tax=Trichonephila clavata TaxID=2740835 RepID=A0A8X6GW83_TRICU|nr:hypothetical protein TNCT_557951 [Trichonephila clavata]